MRAAQRTGSRPSVRRLAPLDHLAGGPQFRADKITFVNNANTVNAVLPTGTIAGDTLLLFASHGFGITNPSGFTTIYGSGGAYYAGWKVATSTDITNGYITCSWGGTFYGEVGIVAITAANASPVRAGIGDLTGLALVAAVGSSAVVPVGDLLVTWCSQRLDDTGVAMTMSPLQGTSVDFRTDATKMSAGLTVDKVATAQKLAQSWLSSRVRFSPNNSYGIVIAVDVQP